MGNAEWIQTVLTNANSPQTLTIGGAFLFWGKWYTFPNKDAEVSQESIDQGKVPTKGTLSIASCGRDNASSGTQGGYDVYAGGPSPILNIRWDDPWANGTTNTFGITNNDPDNWIASQTPFPTTGAEIGTINIKIAYIGG